VTDTTIQVHEKVRAISAARIGWTVLILATLYVCYFSHLGAIGFVGPDEPRYAWIARDMVETGDWVTPRLYGKPWFEKPPLFYWGGALCFKLFGVSEAAARLPSAISALLATLALAWLALRLYGSETARWLLLLLPTTVGMIGFSHAAATDMPFSGILTIAMIAAAVVLGLVPRPVAPSSSFSSAPLTFFAAALFGFFLGLAVLAKGPVGIVLCGGAVFFWALFTKRWSDTFRLFHPAGIVTFCITALPWYILCARRNPDFFRIFIIEHNFKRYLTPEFQHTQPLWFYIPILLLGCLPWTFLLLPAAMELRESFRQRLESAATGIFLASWSLFPLFFFTLSKSKLPGYILPAIPPLVLLCSSVAAKLLTMTTRIARFILSYTTIATIAVISIVIKYTLEFRKLSIFDKQFGYRVEIGMIVFNVAVYLVGMMAPVLVQFRRSKTGLICTVVALVGFVWLGTITTLHRCDFVLSTRYESQAIAEIADPKMQLFLCDVPRSYSYGYAFYFRHELPEWNRRTSEERTMVILGPACWDEIKKPARRLRWEVSLPLFVIETDPDSAARPPGGGKTQ
jgi:4-amino-4-deoxy-L-arabinose transferase-like glycosyltransferase